MLLIGMFIVLLYTVKSSEIQ